MMAKPTRTTVVLVAASLALAAAATVAKLSTRSMPAGADFGVVCAAATVFASGNSPYDGVSLEAVWTERQIALTYPPLVVRALGAACGRVPFWILVLGAAALTIVIVSRVPGVDSISLTTTAVVSGFGAFPWLVLTANLATIEGVTGAIATLGLVAGRPRLFGAALGFAGFVKMAPLFLLVAAVARWPASGARRAIGAGLLVLAALQISSYFIEPAATVGYWRALADGFGGHVARELRLGGSVSPSHFSFLPLIGAHLGIGRWPGLAAAAFVTLAGAVAWLRLWSRSSRDESGRLWLAATAMMLIALGYPRFKPYTLFLLTPLLAVALSTLTARARNVALLLTCLLPCLAILPATYAASSDQLPLAVDFMLTYSQWLLAALVMAVMLSVSRFRVLAETATRSEARSRRTENLDSRANSVGEESS